MAETTNGKDGPTRLIAGTALRDPGADPGRATDGAGWTNATGLAERFVVRVAHRPATSGVPAPRRPPAEVDARTPRGHEWVLTRRVPGADLEELWPSLTDDQRVSALHQVCSGRRVARGRAVLVRTTTDTHR